MTIATNKKLTLVGMLPRVKEAAISQMARAKAQPKEEERSEGTPKEVARTKARATCGKRVEWSHTDNTCPEKDAHVDMVRIQYGTGAAHHKQKVTFQLETNNDQEDR